MPPSGSRQRKLDEQRERILGGAMLLFSSLDYDEVTMQDIADASALSKGTLYLHFRSKEELALALVQHSLARLEGEVARAAALPVTASERIERIARAYIQHALGDSERGWDPSLLARLAIAPDPREAHPLRERVASLIGAVSQVFEEGAVDRSIRPDLKVRTIICVFALAARELAAIEKGSPGEPLPETCHHPKDLMDEFLEVFMRYIRG